MSAQSRVNDEARIYLINVGANSRHQSRARSPIFVGQTSHRRPNFRYVPFYGVNHTNLATKAYPTSCHPFLNPNRIADILKFAHADPDWENLTYGDNCVEPRGAALKNAQTNDIFLFWGALFENSATDWQGFTGAKGWYLFGCLRIQHVLTQGSRLSLLEPQDQARALGNVHFRGGTTLPLGDYVFLGDTSRSCAFTNAVDLQVTNDNGLIYKAFRSADGIPLSRNGRPRWFSSLRSCRIVLDLSKREDRNRAEILRQAIKIGTNFDMLRDVRGR